VEIGARHCVPRREAGCSPLKPLGPACPKPQNAPSRSQLATVTVAAGLRIPDGAEYLQASGRDTAWSRDCWSNSAIRCVRGCWFESSLRSHLPNAAYQRVTAQANFTLELREAVMAGAEAFSAVHSARSASIGSVAAALTAGIAHAIRATASRRVIAHAKRTRL